MGSHGRRSLDTGVAAPQRGGDTGEDSPWRHVADDAHNPPGSSAVPFQIQVGAAARWCNESEFFIDSLLVRIRLFIEMMLVDRPCAMGV